MVSDSSPKRSNLLPATTKTNKRSPRTFNIPFITPVINLYDTTQYLDQNPPYKTHKVLGLIDEIYCCYISNKAI